MAKSSLERRVDRIEALVLDRFNIDLAAVEADEKESRQRGRAAESARLEAEGEDALDDDDDA